MTLFLIMEIVNLEKCQCPAAIHVSSGRFYFFNRFFNKCDGVLCVKKIDSLDCCYDVINFVTALSISDDMRKQLKQKDYDELMSFAKVACPNIIIIILNYIIYEYEMGIIMFTGDIKQLTDFIRFNM